MYNNPRAGCSHENITINTIVPLRHGNRSSAPDDGYGIPKDTVNPNIKMRIDDFNRTNSLNLPNQNSLLPSPTSSFNSWGGKHASMNDPHFAPRIVISPPVDSDTVLPLPPRRTHRKSLCTAVVLAAVITSIVTILIALLIFSE
ncbi:unnamed protein product [Auanema sp. JU1783]|nr:unnamed protein product [Auanema sp. JU1783]